MNKSKFIVVRMMMEKKWSNKMDQYWFNQLFMWPLYWHTNKKEKKQKDRIRKQDMETKCEKVQKTKYY